MKWVNDAVDVASGLGYVELASAVLMITLILILSCAGFFYFGELYKLMPGWGPVTKFDAESGEDIRVRQHVLYQEKRTQDKKEQLASAEKKDDSYGSMDKYGETIKLRYDDKGRLSPYGEYGETVTGYVRSDLASLPIRSSEREEARSSCARPTGHAGAQWSQLCIFVFCPSGARMSAGISTDT